MFIRLSSSRCADSKERNASSLSTVVSVGGISAESCNSIEKGCERTREKGLVCRRLESAYLIAVHRKDVLFVLRKYEGNVSRRSFGSY